MEGVCQVSWVEGLEELGSAPGGRRLEVQSCHPVQERAMAEAKMVEAKMVVVAMVVVEMVQV